MELIDKQVLLANIQADTITSAYSDGRFYGKKLSAMDIIDDIRKAPTIDAVPVVRCKDCKYQDRCGVSDIFFCSDGENLHIVHDLNGYCADGERKDD